MKIFPYNTASKSVKALSQVLPAKIIRRERSRFNGGGVVINWGSPVIPNWIQPTRVLNHPSVMYIDKLDFFIKMADHDWLPPFATNREEAKELRFPVVCRTLLNSHSGKGIVIAADEEELVGAKLYVQYIPKMSEYRIHFFVDNIIDIQKKIRNPNIEIANWQVRCHRNGFIYIRNDIDVPDVVKEVAEECAIITPLGFGAIDIVYNKRSNRAYVLEINTAPGIEGHTVEMYAENFRKIV